MERLPNRLRELRTARKLSLDTLAAKANCSKMQLSGLERGNIALNLSWMQRLAPLLGVTPAELLNPEDNPLGPVDEERELIARLRAASDQEREAVLKMAMALLKPAGEQHSEAA